MPNSLPPLPPDFTLDAQSSSGLGLPPLPAGFTLDRPVAQRSPNEAVEAAKKIGSEIIRPLAKGAYWPLGVVEDAAVQGENIVGNLANRALGRQPTPNYPLPSAEFNAELNRLTVAPKTRLGQVTEDLSSMVVAPPIGLAEKGASRAIVKAEPFAAEAAERARDYVTQNLGLDWNRLSSEFKDALTRIASKAENLDKLNPEAVSRQARLQSLAKPIPATRGQLTRDPIQLRNEGNVAATEAGRPIRNIYVAQNKALLDNLDVLKGKARGTAETPEQLGQSVQDNALRTKLTAKQAQVRSLYRLADQSGETAQQVSIQPLRDLIAQTPDKTHLVWVSSWLKDMGKNGLKLKALPIKTLEDLRQAAVARAMDGGTEGYYAHKVIDAIDQTTEGAGGDLYKAARAARREEANEFEEQGSVSRLVSNKSRTDRATALENTWRQTVIAGSLRDLRNVKRSLLTGGTRETRTAGRQAWRDIRAQTIQYIKDEASKSVTRFEDGTPNVTPAAMERAIRSIGNAKFDEIFGPGTTHKIHQIMEAARDVKTEPPEAPSGGKGSSTWRNVLAFLESNMDRVPVLRHLMTIKRGVVALNKLGEGAREARRATLSALDEEAARNAPKAAQSRQTLRSLGLKAVPSAALILQNNAQ